MNMNEKIKTNADRIWEMTDEELAELLISRRSPVESENKP